MAVTRRSTRMAMKTSSMTRKAPKMAVGSRAQVWHGTAAHTSGGLTKKDLMHHNGRIVSRKAHANGKKAMARMKRMGVAAKPFTRRSGRKMRS